MVNQSLYKLVDNIYDSSYSALSQSKVGKDKEDTMLLSIVHEMSLCFCEFFVLLFLLIVSLFSVNLVFKAMFMGSIVVLFVNAYLVEEWN